MSNKFAITHQGISILARMPEFHMLNRREVESLAVHDPKVHKAGETLLVSGGGDMKAIVALLAGSCKIVALAEIRGKKFSTFIETINAPAILGEVTAFSSPSSVRKVDVVAAQRCLAMTIPSKTLLSAFETSRATLPRMLWDFARLGLARIRMSFSNFNRLYDKHVGKASVKRLDLAGEFASMEKMIGSAPGKGIAVDEKTFDVISVLLDKVNTALAFVSHFDHMPDYYLPEGIEKFTESAGALSPLSVATLKSTRLPGATIKKSLTESLEAMLKESASHHDWQWALEELIISLDELIALLHLKYHINERRRTYEGSERMIDGFTARIEKELDAIENDALARFTLDALPEWTDTEAHDRLSFFLRSRVKEIRIRQLTAANPGEEHSEYMGSGEEQIRNHVAMETYYRLSSHPVVRVVTNKKCASKWDCQPELEEEEINLLNLFCRGCRLVYPILEEGHGTPQV